MWVESFRQALGMGRAQFMRFPSEVECLVHSEAVSASKQLSTRTPVTVTVPKCLKTLRPTLGTSRHSFPN